MKTNKEIINKLEAYFLKQDSKKIARALACMLIDINRILSLDILPVEEKAWLIARMHMNQDQLIKFVKSDNMDEFELYNIES